MPLLSTKRLTEQTAFKTPLDATRAIQNTAKWCSDVRTIQSPADRQKLVRDLNTLKPAFGVVIVTPKEG